MLLVVGAVAIVTIVVRSSGSLINAKFGQLTASTHKATSLLIVLGRSVGRSILSNNLNFVSTRFLKQSKLNLILISYIIIDLTCSCDYQALNADKWKDRDRDRQRELARRDTICLMMKMSSELTIMWPK